jgi:hypothetical protein
MRSQDRALSMQLYTVIERYSNQRGITVISNVFFIINKQLRSQILRSQIIKIIICVCIIEKFMFLIKFIIILNEKIYIIIDRKILYIIHIINKRTRLLQ